MGHRNIGCCPRTRGNRTEGRDAGLTNVGGSNVNCIACDCSAVSNDIDVEGVSSLGETITSKNRSSNREQRPVKVGDTNVDRAIRGEHPTAVGVESTFFNESERTRRYFCVGVKVSCTNCGTRSLNNVDAVLRSGALVLDEHSVASNERDRRVKDISSLKVGSNREWSSRGCTNRLLDIKTRTGCVYITLGCSMCIIGRSSKLCLTICITDDQLARSSLRSCISQLAVVGSRHETSTCRRSKVRSNSDRTIDFTDREGGGV